MKNNILIIIGFTVVILTTSCDFTGTATLVKRSTKDTEKKQLVDDTKKLITDTKKQAATDPTKQAATDPTKQAATDPTKQEVVVTVTVEPENKTIDIPNIVPKDSVTQPIIDLLIPHDEYKSNFVYSVKPIVFEGDSLILETGFSRKDFVQTNNVEFLITDNPNIEEIEIDQKTGQITLKNLSLDLSKKELKITVKSVGYYDFIVPLELPVIDQKFCEIKDGDLQEGGDGVIIISRLRHFFYVKENLNKDYYLISNMNFPQGTTSCVSYYDEEDHSVKEAQAKINLDWYDLFPLSTKDSPFTGTFNGGGNTIEGLYIDKPNDDTVGFFGYVTSGTGTKKVLIENLDFVGSFVAGKQEVGTVAGFVHNADIKRITITTGTVKGRSSFGGVIGVLSDGVFEGYVKDIKILGNSETSSYLGGVVGVLQPKGIIRANVGNVIIDVIDNNNNIVAAGGLVGTMHLESEAVGTVLGITFNKKSETIGGLVGFITDEMHADKPVDKSTLITGYVTSPNIVGIRDVGGLIGKVEISINNVLMKVSGYVITDDDSQIIGDSYTGGLIGSYKKQAHSEDKISGFIKGVKGVDSKKPYPKHIGFVLGELRNSALENNFRLYHTGKGRSTDTPGKTGKIIKEQNENTEDIDRVNKDYFNFDYDDDWEWDEDPSRPMFYPYLRDSLFYEVGKESIEIQKERMTSF